MTEQPTHLTTEYKNWIFQLFFLHSKPSQHYHSHHLEDNLLLLVRKQINSFINSSSTHLLFLFLLLLLVLLLLLLLFIFLLLLFIFLLLLLLFLLLLLLLLFIFLLLLYLSLISAQDGTITLWDLSSTRAIRELKGHTSRVTSLTYSSDGTLLGSCGYDNTINLWNIKSILAPSTRYDMYCEYLY